MINEELMLEEVALRKESVDRKRHYSLNLPSSPVALRKESVDRKGLRLMFFWLCGRSLSARRAWIENNISTNYHVRIRQVALRKESVDRKFQVCTVA